MEWFVSPGGRKVMNIVAGIAAGGGFAAYLTPHSFLIDKTKEFLQMYEGAKPVELPDELLNKAKQVLEETTLSNKEKSKITFFTTVGTDVALAGSAQLKQGAIIGIPLSYKYRSLSDINPQMLQLIQKSDDFSWNSKLGQRILTTLLMSNRAQQFSIARQIYYANTQYVYFTGFAGLTNFLAVYSTARYFNTKLNLYARPFPFRLALYSIVGSMGFVTFFFMKDLLNVRNEMYADKMAAELGKNYILGGLEYYEYLIERNKSLREALGKRGESLFTAGGNFNEYVRVSQLPLTNRFNFMKECLKKMEGKTTEGKALERESASASSKLSEKVAPPLSNPTLEKEIPLRGV